MTNILCCMGNSDTSDNIKGREIRNVIILALSFTFVFTAYLSLQNLQSSLNQEEGLGVVSLSCLYAFIIVSSVLAPTFVKVVGDKVAIVIPWIIHVLYTGANFYPTFATLIPVSVLLGLFSGPLWVAQCMYIAKISQSVASTDQHAVLSKMNGIFFTIYETTQIAGNILSSVILNQGTEEQNASSIASCGAQDCPLATNATQIVQPEKYVVNIMLAAFIALDVIGLLLTVFLLPTIPRSAWATETGIGRSLSACFAGLGDWKLACLVPFIIISAQEQAVLWTDFTKSFISCPYGVHRVGYVMATYGAVTTASALVTSRLAARTGRQILIVIACGLTMAAFVIMLLWKPLEGQIYGSFTIATIWGLAEGIWQTQSNSLIAVLFPDNIEAAFANYHSWKAFGFTVYFAMSNFVCVYIKLIYVISLLTLALILYVFIEIMIYRKKK